MKINKSFLFIILIIIFGSCSNKPNGNSISSLGIYSDEESGILGRGLVSFDKNGDHTQISWRLLPEDPKDVSFNIYRKEIGGKHENYKLIGHTELTSYTDKKTLGKRYAYSVRPVTGGREGQSSRESIPLTPVGGKAALVLNLGQPHKQIRVVTGDLNGDGEPEFVVAYSGYQGVDPYETAWSKSEDTIKVAAFLPTGERLWVMDLGRGIEAGPDYQPMVVWDLDTDGRAEVILKTNKSEDPLNYEGERITVLDGMTGKIKKESKWPPVPWSTIRKTPGALSDVEKGIWSDYNNDSRNYLGIAHLDGKDPYLIAARGTYKAQKMWAFDKNMHRVWERDLGLDHYLAEGFPRHHVGLWKRMEKFWNIDDKTKHLWARVKNIPNIDQYRASHRLPIADINEDGKEEILWGERCIGEKGEDLWKIKERTPYPGHPDIVFAADILPSHKGKEIFYGREGGVGKSEKIGVCLADSQGNILWGHWGYHHIDTGWVGKIIADQEGMQCLAIDLVDKIEAKAGPWEMIKPLGLLWASDGKLIGNPPASFYESIPVDWDGDGIREIVFMKDGRIQKYGGPVIEKLTAPCLWGADLFGDHREEIVAAPGDGNVYVFFNTVVLVNTPRITPMGDRQYKNDLSRTAMQATVVPTEGGYIPRKSRR